VSLGKWSDPATGVIGKSKKRMPTLAIEKIGDWKKLEILVQNQSFLKYCRCTNYCKHLATAGEITQQES